MNVGVIVYHKNAGLIYPSYWIEKFRESILNQSYQNFTIFEVEYNDGGFRVFENSVYESRKLPNFVHAMNYLLDKSFYEMKYDYIFNTNVDDYYARNWIETILPKMDNYDLVASNFCLVKNNKIFHHHHFHNLDVKKELEINHNVIAHPSVCYSKHFWNGNRYNPSEIPIEDMLLWKRAISSGYKVKICEENLLFHRIHDNSVGRNLKEA